METISQIINNSDSILDKQGKYIARNIYCAMPAIVESVNYSNQTLEAKPVTIMKYTDKDGVKHDLNMPLLVDVPFQCFKGGGYSITVPVKAGDECLIIFTDVDFSAWFQNGGFNHAEHSFIHSYTNAMALIGFSSEVNAIPNYNQNGIEIRNSDGSEKISVTSGNITIKSATITLDGTTTINGIEFLGHVHGNGNQGNNTTGVQQ